MKLFIDFETGTWGNASRVVIFDAFEEGAHMDNTDGDEGTVFAFLDNASDEEINALGWEIYQRQFGNKDRDMDLLDDPWRLNYTGPVECVDIAAKNAGIDLTLAQTRALANELIAIGANFDA